MEVKNLNRFFHEQNILVNEDNKIFQTYIILNYIFFK